MHTPTQNSQPSRRSHALWLAGAVSLLCACGGETSDPLPADGGAGPGDGDGAVSGPEGCSSDALFSLRPLGEEGTDVVRHIQVDPASGQLLFSGYLELHQVPLAGGEPQKLGSLLGTLDGAFWLSGAQILVPGGITLPIVENADPVLLSMPRAGGELTSLVEVAHATSLNERFDMRDIVVVGDEVYWIGLDQVTTNPAAIPVKYDTTYVVRKTSWKTPAEPQELYSSKFDLSDLLVTSEHLLVSERTAMGNDDYSTTQKLLPAGGGPAQDALSLLGGSAIAGSGAWLLVELVDYVNPASAGVFRVRGDGTGAERLIEGNGFLSGHAVHEAGFIVAFEPSTLEGSSAMTVYDLGFTGKARRLGCVPDGVTVHGVGASASTAYVGIHGGDAEGYENTILRFAR